MAKRKSKPTAPEIITSEGGIDNGKRVSGETPPPPVVSVATSLPRSVVKDGEDCYIYNEDTGELRLVRARAGYAPAPMPFGFRLARTEEIPGK